MGQGIMAREGRAAPSAVLPSRATQGSASLWAKAEVGGCGALMAWACGLASWRPHSGRCYRVVRRLCRSASRAWPVSPTRRGVRSRALSRSRACWVTVGSALPAGRLVMM